MIDRAIFYKLVPKRSFGTYLKHKSAYKPCKINLHFRITDVKKYSMSIEEYELNPGEARSEILPAI